MSHTTTLRDMGYSLTAFDQLDNGKFVQAVRVGNLVYTSGQISSWDGHDVKGKVGGEVPLALAQQGASYCALNNLRAVVTLGIPLEDIVRTVKILGMVNVADGFDDTAGVINGCSDLLRDALGDAGLHARSAVGMTLPFNWAVEVEAVFEVR